MLRTGTVPTAATTVPAAIRKFVVAAPREAGSGREMRADAVRMLPGPRCSKNDENRSKHRAVIDRAPTVRAIVMVTRTADEVRATDAAPIGTGILIAMTGAEARETDTAGTDITARVLTEAVPDGDRVLTKADPVAEDRVQEKAAPVAGRHSDDARPDRAASVVAQADPANAAFPVADVLTAKAGSAVVAADLSEVLEDTAAASVRRSSQADAAEAGDSAGEEGAQTARTSSDA